MRDTHAAVQAGSPPPSPPPPQRHPGAAPAAAGSVAAQLEGLSTRFGSAVGSVADTWAAARPHERSTDTPHPRDPRCAGAFAARFEAGATALLATLKDSHATLQGELAAADTQRLAAMTASVEALAAAPQGRMADRGRAHPWPSREQICQTLGDTARAMSADARAQASQTIGEVTRLMETAAEAPCAPPRSSSSCAREPASMARDNTLLEERSRIMETLATLLDAINHASTEQRGAIDALVALRQPAGGDRQTFEAQVDSESAKIAEATILLPAALARSPAWAKPSAWRWSCSTESSDKLMETLQRIEGSLKKSVARSDEQLGHYVAQAREIIDLSVMSQKADRREPAGSPSQQASSPGADQWKASTTTSNTARRSGPSLAT